MLLRTYINVYVCIICMIHIHMQTHTCACTHSNIHMPLHVNIKYMFIYSEYACLGAHI